MMREQNISEETESVADDGAGDDAEAQRENGGELGDGGSQTELADLQSEMESLNERHLRLAAEFDNYRKRIDRERAQLTYRSQASLVERLLDALDDLERFANVREDATTVQALHEAVELVDRKLRQALGAAGLERLAPEGEPFDPETMEALATLPTQDPEEDDVVSDVFQPGYRFKDHLIRPARVRVRKYE